MHKERVAPLLAFILMLLLLSPATDALSQWRRVPHDSRLDGSSLRNTGTITFKDGVVWAGDSNLSVSFDSGKTWAMTNYPAVTGQYAWPICCIQFFDRLTGFVVPYGSESILLTRDGGFTWKSILFQTFGFPYSPIQGAVGPTSADIMIADVGIGATTHDGGQSWNVLGGNSYWTLGSLHGILYSLCYTSSTGDKSSLTFSNDAGRTWAPLPSASIGSDVWEMAFDSCSSRIYLANENYFSNNPLSHIYRSSDFGQTWDSVFFGPQGYVTGAIQCGKRAVYFASRYNGILRSLDFGTTWQSIGGPNGYWDSHTLCVINDNLLLAIDTDGSIWRTTNSGGSWVTASEEPTSYTFVPSQLFDSVSLLACDSPVVRIAFFTTSACDDLSMDSERIIGKDSAYFSIASGLPKRATGYDSVAIRFHPDSARDYSATYSATIGGRTVTITLRGHSSKGRILSQSDSSLRFDTIQTCDAGAVKEAFILSESCGGWNVLSASITGADSSHFAIIGRPPSRLTGRDSLQLLFTADSNRAYTAQVVLTMEDGTVKRIQLSGYAATSSIPVPRLGVTMKPASYSTSALGTVDIPFYLTGNLDAKSSQTIGLQTVTLDLAMNTDLLTPIAANPAIQTIPQIPVQITKNAVTLSVTLPANLTFTDSTLLMTLHCQAFVSDTMQTAITLTNATFASQNATACFAQSTSNRSSRFALIASCGDSILTGDLAHGVAFTIESIVPNPTSGKVTVVLLRSTDHAIRYELCDVLGDVVASGLLSVGQPPPNPRLATANQRLQKAGEYYLNFGAVPSGSYYLRLSTQSQVESRRIILAR